MVWPALASNLADVRVFGWPPLISAKHPSVLLSAATSPRLLSPDSGDIKAFLCFRHRARPEPQPSLPFMAGAKSVTLAVYAEIDQPGGGWVLPRSFAWMHSSVICGGLFDGFTGVVYPAAYFSQAA